MRSNNPKLRKLYKFIKENLILDTNNEPTGSEKPLLETAQIFSIQIFYNILFLFAVIKTILTSIYFIFFQNILFNFNMSLIILEITFSFLLTQQQTLIDLKNKKLKNFVKINESNLGLILQVIYVFIFCLEENLTIYYYDHYLYHLNPGFSFIVIFLIIFYDLNTTKKFHEYVFYLYILNLVFLIYFISLRNIMNFFVPLNLVMCMFVLLNLISRKFQKKLKKINIYHQFFESLVDSLFKLNKNEMFIIYNRKIIFEADPDQTCDIKSELQQEEEFNDRKFSTEISNSNSRDEFDEDFKTIPISDFVGFQLALPKKDKSSNLYFNKNKLLCFLNLLFFLKNSQSLMKDPKNEYQSEYENIFENSKFILKNKDFKFLLEKRMSAPEFNFSTRNKCIVLLVCIIFEVNYREHVEKIEISNKQIEFYIYQDIYDQNLIEKYHQSFSSIIIQQASNCLNFTMEDKILSDNKIVIRF